MTSASSMVKPLSSEATRQGAVADGAVDVGDDAARSTDHVVVVVADAGLVARHRTGGLDASNQTGGAQRVERVVDGLVRHLGQVLARGADDRFGVGVGVRVHRAQHGDPRLGDSQRGGAQQLPEVSCGIHTDSVNPFLESVKRWWARRCATRLSRTKYRNCNQIRAAAATSDSFRTAAQARPPGFVGYRKGLSIARSRSGTSGSCEGSSKPAPRSRACSARTFLRSV